MQYKDLDTALHFLIEKAYLIAEQKGIHLNSKKIPRPEDPGYKSFRLSMGESIRQQLNEHDLISWFDEVATIFERFGLQTARFNTKVNSYDKATDSDEPFPVFTRRLKELEKIQEDAEYRKRYISLAFKPPMSFKHNTLAQGSSSYSPTNDEYLKVISLLWDSKRITSPSGKILKKERHITKSALEHKTGISQERLKDISRGINISAKSNGMQIYLRYPDNIYLEIVQSYK